MAMDGVASQIGRFAVWLLPESRWRADFAKVIRGLAAQHGAAVFEPHVTLFAGSRTAADALGRIVTAVVSGADAFVLETTGLGYTEDFFKTVFITFKRDPVLARLSRAVGQRLAQPQQYDFQPHLSLLYKEMPEDAKKAIIAGLHVPRGQIVFDEVAVVNPGPTGDWRDVANWEIEFSLLLGGARG